MPVDMRNQIQSDPVDARIGCRGSVLESGQLPAIRWRQVPPGHPDLLLNEVEVVQQPLSCRGVAPLALGRYHDQLVRLDQYALILVESCNEFVLAASRVKMMRCRKTHGMSFQLFDVKQLGT